MGVAIGLAFSGLGWLGQALIQELPGFPELRLVGVQDVSAELVAEVATGFGSPWQGTSYESLLSAPGVDAVVISTPNALHVPQTGAALRAGKHVLVQKPLALSPADARATLALAEATGKVLFVDYTYRYLETVELLVNESQSIGPIRRVRGVFHNIYGPGKAWFFNPRLGGGGALVDLGVHLLDLALHLLHPVDVVMERAEIWHSGDLAVEDSASITARLDQAELNLEVSWNAGLPSTEISLTLEGDAGTLRWENVDGSFYRFRTLLDGTCLLDRETRLRDDSLRAFQAVLRGSQPAPAIDPRVYDLLALAYGGGGGQAQSQPPSAHPATARQA